MFELSRHEIESALGDVSTVTAFRYLRQVPYRRSYNHNGRYYCLHEPSRYDRFAPVRCSRRRRGQSSSRQRKVPPGAEGVNGLISTMRLSAEQQWSPTIDAPRVGDAVTRTVAMQAGDVSAMAFAPLEHAAMSGVGIYPAVSTVNDTTDRGSLTGKRIEGVSAAPW